MPQGDSGLLGEIGGGPGQLVLFAALLPRSKKQIEIEAAIAVTGRGLAGPGMVLAAAGGRPDRVGLVLACMFDDGARLMGFRLRDGGARATPARPGSRADRRPTPMPPGALLQVTPLRRGRGGGARDPGGLAGGTAGPRGSAP
ncbi:MAG: lipocalin family protein [Rhodopseudomonas palustris]|nr:lipocalin family protein [Rhodopseudomonas palustris]